MICLRAGLQHVGAASQPQLGAASQPQLGAGAAHGAGAHGAGAAQGAGAAHGAGASQPQLGAGASQPQLGATSQQLFLQLSLLMMPLILHPRFNLGRLNFGRQTGAASQHDGAGASQQTGAGSQQEFFLQNKPAEAFEDEIAANATTAKVTINRRMELSPKQKVFVNRAVNTLALISIRDMIQCHHSLMAVDAKSVTDIVHPEIGNANEGSKYYLKLLVGTPFLQRL